MLIGILCAVGALFVVWAAIVLISAHRILRSRHQSVGRTFAKMEKRRDFRREDESSYRQEKVSVVSDDGLKLTGWLLPCNYFTEKVVLFVHGFTANHRLALPFVNFFHSLDYDVLAIDLRAHGESEGRYSTYGLLESQDLKNWVRFLRARYGEHAAIGLMGQSMGGAAVLQYARGDGELLFCVADCTFTSAQDAVHYHLRRSHLDYPLFYRPITAVLRAAGKFNIADADSLAAVREIRCPLLFVHGTADRMLPCEMSQRLYDAADGDRELLLVEGARHVQNLSLGRTEYFDAITRLTRRAERRRAERDSEDVTPDESR